jgi:hypothetical protein
VSTAYIELGIKVIGGEGSNRLWLGVMKENYSNNANAQTNMFYYCTDY